MKKLYEILKYSKEEIPTGEYGIEIEVEGENLKSINNKHWKTEDDGSLRGRFPNERSEYVLKKPIPMTEVRTALENLAEHQKESTLNFSFRTSVHVHMNVLELTIPQVLSIIYTYLLMEEPFMTFCGRERKGNRFCLRIADAEGLMEYLNNMFRHTDEASFLKLIDQERVRYASINIAALVKYGSLEFRGMKGTLDVDKLCTWVNMLNEIKEFATSHHDPVDVHEHIAAVGVDTFARCILRDTFSYAEYPRLVREIQQNFSITLDLPYAYHHSRKKATGKTTKVKTTFGFGAELGGMPRAAEPFRAADFIVQTVGG